MDLNDEQKAKVSTWISEGADLNAIQERLREELEITITYLETRFLIADLGLEIQEPVEEVPEEKEEEADAPAPEPTGGVSVIVDQIAIPGTMASGKVTFSDGIRSGWYVDQAGSLGLEPETEGYQPSEPDIITFQNELHRLLG
jgi:hypothetical protein